MKIPQDLFANPFRMQPGLRRIEPGMPHFTPIRPGDAAFHEKLAVLRDATQDGLLITPGFDAMPALRRALDVLAVEHPQHVQTDNDGWHLPALQARIARDDAGVSFVSPIKNADFMTIESIVCSVIAPAWALLQLSVLEDMAVLRAPAGELDLLAVCLPSHWAPRDKIGKPFAQVHAPVADNALLLSAAQGLMRLVTAPGNDRWERYVWTLSPSMKLDGHPTRCHREWPLQLNDEALLASTIFRLERQTFITLPEQQQAVFTIAVHTRPVLEALDSAQLAALHDSLQSMSDAVLEYRSFTPVRDAWLRALMGILQ